jgi:hypothetical protein
MKDQYDFSTGKRGAIEPMPRGKTRITIRIDDDVLDWFRGEVHAAGGGNYQKLLNHAWRDYVKNRRHPREDMLGRVGREELSAAKTAGRSKRVVA